MWSGADVDPRVALLAVRLAVPLAAGSNDVSMVPGMCREAAAQGRCKFVTNMINFRRLARPSTICITPTQNERDLIDDFVRIMKNQRIEASQRLKAFANGGGWVADHGPSHQRLDDHRGSS
jgi:hypothetical protein